MQDAINASEIYDKNLNFLIGSGASVGLFPTLALEIKDAAGKRMTIESLATDLGENSEKARTALFMHYYLTCIWPAQSFSTSDVDTDTVKAKALNNYERFLRTTLQLLQRRRPLDKRCNVFTTNYDPCFALAADAILKNGDVDFVLNDGSRGFMRRYLQPRNYNSFLCQTGIFELHTSSIPQINLVHLHGSIYWQRQDGNIIVDYRSEATKIVSDAVEEKLGKFSAALLNDALRVADLPDVDLSTEEIKEFWKAYNALPIVNPTKWKFHETVFEEHYYQMLRSLSYELEKPNAILVTFGFSFSDEHILSLVKRSLSNPTLQVFVCCFNEAELLKLRSDFLAFPNVQCIGRQDEGLDFTYFNDSIFDVTELLPGPGLFAGAQA